MKALTRENMMLFIYFVFNILAFSLISHITEKANLHMKKMQAQPINPLTEITATKILYFE